MAACVLGDHPRAHGRLEHEQRAAQRAAATGRASSATAGSPTAASRRPAAGRREDDLDQHALQRERRREQVGVLVAQDARPQRPRDRAQRRHERAGRDRQHDAQPERRARQPAGDQADHAAACSTANGTTTWRRPRRSMSRPMQRRGEAERRAERRGRRARGGVGARVLAHEEHDRQAVDPDREAGRELGQQQPARVRRAEHPRVAVTGGHRATSGRLAARLRRAGRARRRARRAPRSRWRCARRSRRRAPRRPGAPLRG